MNPKSKIENQKWVLPSLRARDPSVIIASIMWRLFPLLLLLASCTFGSGNFDSRYSSDLEARRLKRVAVFPLEALSGEAESKIPFAPAGPGNRRGGEYSSASLLSHQLYSAMVALPAWQIVSDREVSEMEPLVPKGSPEARARRLGQLVYADAVISGRILRFREREGEALGAMSPASVAFVLEMWDVRRGDVVWSAHFDETQKPLSQNLFALGDLTTRGVRWLKAEELSLEGVKKAVNQLHQALYRKST